MKIKTTRTFSFNPDRSGNFAETIIATAPVVSGKWAIPEKKTEVVKDMENIGVN